MERLHKIAHTLKTMGHGDLAREVALASLEMKQSGAVRDDLHLSKTASWDGKLVGQDFRLSWTYHGWKLEELPQKGKRKLRVATLQNSLQLSSSSGVRTDAFIPENILRDAGVSASDSYDRVKAKIQDAMAAAAEEVIASGGEWATKNLGWLRDVKWYEDAVHFLQVVPENVEPFTANGSDFDVDVSWTEFEAYSPSSDMNQSDPHYSKIVSTAAASARKLYQTLKANPDALRGVSYDKFDEWLKSNKINYKYEHSAWR